VLSVGNNLSASTLSGASNAITLTTALSAAQSVSAAQAGTDASVNVTFSNANENGIANYAVLVSQNAALSEAAATNLYLGGKTKFVAKTDKNATVTADDTGAALSAGTYYVYVLSVADGTSAIANKLSAPSAVTINLQSSN